MSDISKLLLERASKYFKERCGFDADKNIKMDTPSVVSLMHDFAADILTDVVEVKKLKSKK